MRIKPASSTKMITNEQAATVSTLISRGFVIDEIVPFPPREAVMEGEVDICLEHRTGGFVNVSVRSTGYISHAESIEEFLSRRPELILDEGIEIEDETEWV